MTKPFADNLQEAMLLKMCMRCVVIIAVITALHVLSKCGISRRGGSERRLILIVWEVYVVLQLPAVPHI